MAPLPEWGPVFAQLGELVKSFGSLPAFARWKSIWETLEVRRCGSTVTGLYVPGQSDLDLVLYFRGAEITRPEQLGILAALSEELRQRHASVHSVHLIEAKAPIVQFTMSGLVVDVSVQSVLGLANSSLIAKYCNQSPQLRLLVRKVKEFAHAWNIKSGKDGTLSSYGYTLLCTHFLQNAPFTGVNLDCMPVFPNGVAPWELNVDIENENPNSVRMRKLQNGWPIPPPPQERHNGYLTMPQIAQAVHWMPGAPEAVAAPHVEPRHVVVLFAHFASWLLSILQSGLERVVALQEDQAWAKELPPYVVTIRSRDLRAAWKRLQPRLDRHAFLYIEEPFCGDNVARPLTYEGAIRMQTALRKAIAQLEAHPLARSMGVSSQTLAKARHARKAHELQSAEYASYEQYSVNPHYQFVGAH